MYVCLGKAWQEVGSQGLSAEAPGRQRQSARASSRRNIQSSPGSSIRSLCLSLSLSCLFACGSVCCLAVGLGFACIPGQQVE